MMLRSGIARRSGRLACAGFLTLPALGCGGGEDRAYSRGSTVIVAYGGDERVLNPYFDMPAQLLVFLPLVTRDEHGELEGRLAKSWEHSPDYHEWTYHLRTDVRWHDGVPVTAHDIKFTLDLITHPDVLSFGSGIFESITVLDDSTVTIRYPGTPYSFDWWVVYYPKHLLENLDPKEFLGWEFWTHPVGNGPYRYVRHVPRTMMEFEANPDYYKGKPKIDRVVLKFTGGPGSPNSSAGTWMLSRKSIPLRFSSWRRTPASVCIDLSCRVPRDHSLPAPQDGGRPPAHPRP